MRPPYLLLLIPLASCSSLPSVPAPWDPTESQATEPSQPADAAAPGWVQMGTSVRGKAIEAVNLGNGPRRIYVIGGIHGDEPDGPAAASKLPAALLADFISEPGERVTVRLVRDMNPDGTSSGMRGNTRGIDLNRNWPSRDFRPEQLPGANAGRRAASELEVSTIRADLAAFKPDLVIIFGTAATGRGPEVSFVGRSPAPAYDFSAGARGTDPKWRVLRDQRRIVPGSIESLVGLDMGKTVLAVDFKRGSDVAANVKAVRAGLIGIATTPVVAANKPPKPEGPPVKAPILGH
jgi:hypothetical protein